jgi:ABC-2 type transport system ATP-binding protein
MGTPCVQVRRLTVRFRRKTVLDGLDLDVSAGEVVVLLGENGVGKSTLIRTLLGLHVRQAGEVSVLGLDPGRAGRRVRERVGYVPDRPDAYPWMTVADFFRFLAPHYPTWSQDRALAAAERLDVPTDVPFRELSKGQGMKALLAAALAPDARALFLDEPFSGLDPVVRDTVLRGVIAALRDEGRAVLLATHELDAAARVADRVALLAHGRIARTGTLAEVTGGSADEVGAGPAALGAALAEVAAGGRSR